MADAPHYTGHLSRAGDGIYRGKIVDDAGFVIRLSATIEEVNGHRRFALTGERCAPPDWLHVPLLDGPRQESGEE